MIVATDVHYQNRAGNAAALVFDTWDASTAVAKYVEATRPVLDYQPGLFFERELPCLLNVLAVVAEPYDTVIVDGHVWLADQPGMGHHLYEALNRQVAVVGVAKRPFHEGRATEVLRGNSQTPLYVTAIGVDLELAVERVRTMHGPFRLPTLLKQVDTLCRGG